MSLYIIFKLENKIYFILSVNGNKSYPQAKEREEREVRKNLSAIYYKMSL